MANAVFLLKFPLDCNILPFGAYYSSVNKPESILKSAQKTSRYVELLTSSQGRLFAYIYSLTGDPEQTHDVLQETNRKLWLLMDEYDPKREFLPWAFKVGYNQVRSKKKVSRDRLVFQEDSTLEAIHQKQMDRLKDPKSVSRPRALLERTGFRSTPVGGTILSQTGGHQGHCRIPESKGERRCRKFASDSPSTRKLHSENNDMKHDKLDELLRLKSTGEITPEEKVELENLIRTDEEACRQYLDYTSVDAMLKWQFDETTVPVIPKKPNFITFRRVLMAAAALLVLGLGIHFWPTVEPKDPKAKSFRFGGKHVWKAPYPFRVEFPARPRCRLRGSGTGPCALESRRSLRRLHPLPPGATSPSQD